jgi:enterobacteria phage integrase
MSASSPPSTASPFSVDGFSRFTRDAICSAGLPLDGQPHSLRKTLTRLLADAEATAHEIRLRLVKNPLQRRNATDGKLIAGAGGKRAVVKLNEHRANKVTLWVANS